MKCLYCGDFDSKVIDSRVSDDGATIRRRRECIKCAKRFTTYEKVEPVAIYVVKKDGTRQPFDIDKVRAGVMRACEKRPVPISKIEELVSDIEKSVYSLSENEVQTSVVGDMVSNRLKDLDDVAYVRFASVYKQFKDINTLMDEIKHILGDKSK